MHFDHFFCLGVFSHATSPKCFSYLSEASRIVNKVSRDIRPEFSSVPESHSCFAPDGSTYNCHPVMELTLTTKSPVLDNILYACSLQHLATLPPFSFLTYVFCIFAGKVSPCREVVLLKVIEEVSLV
ncbi:hypothetical protein V6Z11_A02G009000 [Gossypium hirsutum]